MADPSRYATHMGAQQALGSEQHHLGVVGDGAELTVGRHEIDDAALAELLADMLPREELDRGAESIAHRTTEQAAEDGCGGA
ncbi:hypothetical protein D3C84_1251050 [compost metagenome]